jgi:hypothetical protein
VISRGCARMGKRKVSRRESILRVESDESRKSEQDGKVTVCCCSDCDARIVIVMMTTLEMFIAGS